MEIRNLSNLVTDRHELRVRKIKEVLTFEELGEVRDELENYMEDVQVPEDGKI